TVDHAHRHDGGIGDGLTVVHELVGAAMNYWDWHLGVVKGCHDLSFAHDVVSAGGKFSQRRTADDAARASGVFDEEREVGLPVSNAVEREITVQRGDAGKPGAELVHIERHGRVLRG